MINLRSFPCVFLLATAWSLYEGHGAESSPQWRAGTATAVVTPKQLMPMAGYANRPEPATGTEQELYAKAIALEDRGGKRVLFITLDLIGVSSRLRETVTERLFEKHKMPPEYVVLNASHTHCGPAYTTTIGPAEEYFDFLADSLVQLGGQAIENLRPAALSYSHARCGFAMNRRTPTATGYKNHPNPDGPVDHAVPVLRVDEPDGKLRAVLFGYACHNTTMGFRRWLGDYAGYAQEYFEKDHPGVTAHFLMGCGGDQNPYPRSELKYAQQHGRSLATAIEAALEQNQTTKSHQHVIHGPLKTSFDTVELEYTTADRPPCKYPIQIVQFGNDLAIVALASEATIDYSLRLKTELSRPGGPTVWIAGYSNAMEGYIPSRRVLIEGGYEAQSRPWKPELEERIVTKTHEMFGRLNP
jgi:hypothetical protein